MKKGDYHMKRNSIDDVINYAVKADRLTEFRDDTKLLKAFIEAIRLNKDLFLNTNMVDLKSNNGYKIDTNIIDRILNKYEDINSVIEEIKKSFIQGERYTKSEIKEKLKAIYESNGYNKTPKASDLEEYFEIKLCKVVDKFSGKLDNGFLIIKLKT